jgi:hypothetical protein
MIGKRFPLLLLRLRGQLTNGKDHTGIMMVLYYCGTIGIYPSCLQTLVGFIPLESEAQRRHPASWNIQ